MAAMVGRQFDRERREIDRIRTVYLRRKQRGVDARYSLFEPGHLFLIQGLERAVLGALRREGLRSLTGLRILDVGCGGATWLAGLQRYGAKPDALYGVDLRSEPLLEAPRGLNLSLAAGDTLPFAPESFDLVTQVTMLSSVLDRSMRIRIAREMLRVLRPSRFLLWYHFTINPFNPDVRGIGGRELGSLFRGSRIWSERVTLAPPLARLTAPRAWPASLLLEQLAWLRTHLVATVRPRRTLSAVSEMLPHSD
ncbi:MAG: class I SAM-dependent methyltransferase [Dehalococcoidia bacterium]